ncbi:MAG: ATP-binding protein [Thermodesulfobacteriota bacterium]|nr:ATP-binding protein [Thermodesulfobacteriota bacterium]
MQIHKVIKMSSDPEIIPSVIDEIIELLGADCSHKDIIAIRIGLNEIIINAVEHGNLAIDWETKNKALKDGDFDDFIKRRMKEEPFASKVVTIECLIYQKRACFVVSDEGEGFNWRQIPDPRNDENIAIPHGRGISIARFYMDEVHFNEKANEVTLVRHINNNQ